MLIPLCVSLQVTPTELEVAKAILKFEEDPGDLRALLPLVSLRNVLEALRQKGHILKSYKIPEAGEKFVPQDVQFSKRFQTTLYRSGLEMGMELYEAYPPYGEINGAYVQIRTVSKKFDSREDAFRYYAKSISHSPERHSEILEITKWAASKNILSCSLASYIIDRRWEDLSLLRSGKMHNINLDTFKVL